MKFGADSVSHIVMLNQNVARRWKSYVPPVPSCFGVTFAFFGSVMSYDRSAPPLPERFETNCAVGSS